MEKPEITLNGYCRRLFLISVLLASLSLSSGVGLASPAEACDTEGQAPPSSLDSANASLRDVALTAAPNSQAEGQTSRHNRTRHPAYHSGVVAQKLNSPDAAASRFAMDRDTSAAYSSFCFSRPRGRAPPHFN